MLSNGKMNLSVEWKFDRIDAKVGTEVGGTTVPGFDSWRFFKTVELRPGETIALRDGNSVYFVTPTRIDPLTGTIGATHEPAN
jgi:hypothetical protein